MKVIKEVKIKIESVIENLDNSGLPLGDSERSVTELPGFLHYTDDGLLITYSESGEGGEVFSEITYSGGAVTVKRRGAIESELHFKEGEVHKSLYSVPPYKFDAELKTRKIRADISLLGGSLDLHYNMKIGGAEKSARMKIWIKATSN